MASGRTPLWRGARILIDAGTGVVTALAAEGFDVKDSFGDVTHNDWMNLSTILSIEDGRVAALSQPLRPIWDGLDDAARDDALFKLEIVQEIRTGYRDGHPELARSGEPRCPFGPGFGLSIAARCDAMAALLSQDKTFDHATQRRVRDGAIRAGGTNATTVRNWERSWRNAGLLGLIDGRRIHRSRDFHQIDERFRHHADAVVKDLDGDSSTVSLGELDRRTRVRLIGDGVTELVTPQRATRQFLSELKRRRGATTRAQRTARLHEVSGYRHYPAIRPGQVVAIDATTADNLVYDALTGRAVSVQILTAICVATRVVLALRVVPVAANGFEAGLLVYDVCRPFSQSVKGTDISRWRWCGLPEALDLSGCQIQLTPKRRRSVAPDLSTLQGEHHIPAVLPDAIHCDRGSIFLSAHFLGVLGMLGIDLLLSRGGKPTDNPHVERWHETIQRRLQQNPGYKGRNSTERGRLVAEEPLFTAHELQEDLRWFVASDYHRHPHSGLVLPEQREQDGETALICPLEMWDTMIEFTGRIDVPQQPDLIYQFLQMRWLTIGHAGVELGDMAYDSEHFDSYRAVPQGFFRAGDRAAPFYVDPNDLSRIWFPDPETHRVQPIMWRGAERLNAPMTQSILSLIRQRIRNRGGNGVLTRDSATRLILKELGQLAEAPPNRKARAKMTAGAQRVAQSQIDHGEVQSAQELLAPTTEDLRHQKDPLASIRRPWQNLLGGE